jgi:uncharacterized protein YdhG (YjbR/CyaY superfamily)
MTKEVTDYIVAFDAPIAERLMKVHDLFRAELPHIPCVMAYGIPTFKGSKNIIHFGGFKKHIGIYPGPAVIAQLADELTTYTSTKGAIQFPLDQKLPIALLRKIVKAAKNLHA